MSAAQRERRRRAWKKYFWRRISIIAVALCIVSLSVWGVVSGIGALASLLGSSGVSEPAVEPAPTKPVVTPKPPVVPYPVADENTIELDSFVDAPYAVLVDVTEGRIVAQKQPDTKTFPASITKMMTLLVAVENTEDLDSTYTMPFEILNELYIQGASVTGFSAGEEASVKDMLYGCILPSGADATIGLANHIKGSEDAFVKLMNRRCKELGLKNTRFENTSGLHSAGHYSTATDMAVILMAAMKDSTCREVLSTYQYTTAKTPEHPEGIPLTSTLFSRMKGDEPEGATVLGGKTGYTTQAGHTMASYAKGDNGHDYVVVTMGGSNRWQATYDCINLLSRYVGGATDGFYK